MSHVIITMQIQEWYSIIYLIRTQKNRNINEITFDHNHENLAEEIDYSSQT